MRSSDDSSSDDSNAFWNKMQPPHDDTPTSTPTEVETHANKLLNEIDHTSDDVARAGNDPEHRAQVERLRESARQVRESARKSRRQRSRSARRSLREQVAHDAASTQLDEDPLLVEPPEVADTPDKPDTPADKPDTPADKPDKPAEPDANPPAEPASTSVGDFFRNIGTYLQSGIDTANEVDSTATVNVARQVEGVTYTGAAPYRIVFFVLKAFVLACVAAYTFTINTNRCRCAADVRKPLVQWGSIVALVMAVVALVYPKVYSDAPALKLVMMVVSLLVAYGIITYFPMLQHRGCECARPDDWRRWVVEGAVYLVLVLFVLAVVGVGVV